MIRLIQLLTFATLAGTTVRSETAFWKFASTPPMGWNSYDAWGTSVTEELVLTNAHYMQERLLAHGWKYVVIDARWYDSVSPYDDRNFTRERSGAKLFADQSGRLLPATNRFPSAVNGNGFKPLADQIHAMGLKFGLHTMRGIPRQAVYARTPIQDSTFTAADAANTNSICGWCPDMYGVANNSAGQAWYDSCARLWAAWGVDFVKVDDLSNPYHLEEIEMIRNAINKGGHPIVFSTSPGPTASSRSNHISKEANMWRVSGDFWDRWPDLNRAFDLYSGWQGVGGLGHWPDLDMIPFGHIGIKCTIAGPDRWTRFSTNEQVMLMSLWALAPSPLMLGANLPDNDHWTLSLLTNDEVIAVNQDPLGHPAQRVMQSNGAEIWVKELEHGSKAIGLFNRGAAACGLTLDWSNAGLAGQQTVRDLWSHKNLGTFKTEYSTQVPAHGVVLLRVARYLAPTPEHGAARLRAVQN